MNDRGSGKAPTSAVSRPGGGGGKAAALDGRGTYCGKAIDWAPKDRPSTTFAKRYGVTSAERKLLDPADSLVTDMPKMVREKFPVLDPDCMEAKICTKAIVEVVMATRSELIANWAVTVAKLLAFKSKKYAEPYDKEVKAWSAKCASLESKLGTLQAGNYSLKQTPGLVACHRE